MEQRQFCRKGIHDCVPAVTLTFNEGAGRLHWCAEHANDAERYRDSSDQATAKAKAKREAASRAAIAAFYDA